MTNKATAKGKTSSTSAANAITALVPLETARPQIDPVFPRIGPESNPEFDSQVRSDMPSERKPLNAGRDIDAVEPLAEILRRRVIGQNQAIDPLVSSFARFLSGLRDPHRPLLTGLLLGPTGVGKTETAKAIAEALFGRDTALVHIHCEEYSHGHEVAKLLGSPPGYVGHDIEPLLSQARIDAAHRNLGNSEIDTPGAPILAKAAPSADTAFVSVILFDEIEKAHPSVWNALLGLLDEGAITLGDNRTVDFTHSIVLITSNVGSAQMSYLVDENRLGFGYDAPSEGAGHRSIDPGAVETTALTAAHRHFPPELFNRFDEVLVFSPLGRGDLQQILGKFIAEVHQRALDTETPFLLKLTDDAERWVLDHGSDPRFGARPLRRVVERDLVGPLSRLVASEQIGPGDVVEVDIDQTSDSLGFFRSGVKDSSVIV